MTGTKFTPNAGDRSRSGLLAAAAAGLLALVVLAFAVGSPRSASPPRAAIPAAAASAAVPDPHVEFGDAEQVCSAFAAALFTVAAGDTGPREVYRRAAAYATGELAAALVSDQGRLPVPQEHPTPGGVEVTGYIGDHMRAGTDGVAYRAVLVTLTDHDATTTRHVVYCTLHQEAPRWLVAGYEQERTLP